MLNSLVSAWPGGDSIEISFLAKRSMLSIMRHPEILVSDVVQKKTVIPRSLSKPHTITTDTSKKTVVAYTVLLSRTTSDTRGVLPQPALRAKKYLNNVKLIACNGR